MTANRPLALDLCSGLGGWSEGLEAEGWDIIRVDIADMFAQTATPKPPDCLLMLQDIRTFHGSQAARCSLIVASPPCQEFSWMAMPWSRAKQVARALHGDGNFPENYRGSRTIGKLTELFDACFRIQREASDVAGRHIPLIVENVRGAQPWVGRARWAFGSYCLWGDVPALMPIRVRGQSNKIPPEINAAIRNGRSPARWTNEAEHHFGKAPSDGAKHHGDWFRDPTCPTRQGGQTGKKYDDGVKHHGSGDVWFDTGPAALPSASPRRKAASAMIAKIPLTLSRHIAATYRP